MADPVQGKGGPTDPVLEETDDFSGGLVTVAPPHLLETKQSPDCQNVTFTRPFGAMTTRKGKITLWSDTNFAPYWFTEALDANGVANLFGSSGVVQGGIVNGNIYRMNIPTGVSNFYTATAGTPQPQSWRMTTFKSLVLAVNPQEPTLKYTGAGGFVNLLGTPPANGTFITSHRGRVFIANSSAGASRLSYCANNNPEDWTTANDAGFIDIGLGDGDTISGIVSLNTVLIIFKQNSTWALTGSGPTSFVLRQVSGVIGCLDDRSIVKGDQFAIFVARSGIYNVTANANGVMFVDYNIKPSFEKNYLGDDTPGSIGALAAGRYKTEYFISTPGQNTIAFDYVFGTFTTHTFQTLNNFVTRLNGDLLSGGSGGGAAGRVYTHFRGYDDDGVAIPWYYKTKEHDFGNWVNRKIGHDLIVQSAAANGTGETINIDSYINGVGPTSFGSFSNVPVTTENRIIYKAQTHFIDATQPNYLQLRFSGTTTTAGGPVTIYGYSSLADIYERENG